MAVDPTNKYLFQETEGSTAEDSVGSANGSLVSMTFDADSDENGPSESPADYLARSLTLNPAGPDYINVSSLTSFGSGDSWSVSAWIYPTDVTTKRWVITKAGTGAKYMFGIFIQSGDLLGTVWTTTAGNYIHIVTGPTVTINTWQLVCATFTDDDPGGTLTLSVNAGTRTTSSTGATNRQTTGTSPVYIGERSDGGNDPFQGRIAGVTLADGVAWSTADEATLYAEKDITIVTDAWTDVSKDPARVVAYDCADSSYFTIF